MKTTIGILLISLGLINLSCKHGPVNTQSFTLQGKINGVKTGRIILSYESSKKYKWINDTADIKDGKFVFKGKIIEPTSADLIAASEPNLGRTGKELNIASIYIEPGDMKVILTKDKFKELKMTGSKSQNDLNALNLFNKSVTSRIDSVSTIIISLRDSLTKYPEEKNLSEKLKNEYTKRGILNNEKYAQYIEFIKSHPKSFLSADLLLRINDIIPLDSLKLIHNNLAVPIQNSRDGIVIKKIIAKKDNNRIGAIAPDFKAIDLNKQTVTLSEFRGKNVVLMDFWASWCGPCRASFPHLKEVYKKYHPKGFEIISISVDFNRDAWMAAVKQENIETWHPVPVAEKYALGPDSIKKDDIYENYFVQGVPRQILIDKSGKIVGQWLGFSKENENELDKKLAELFSGVQ